MLLIPRFARYLALGLLAMLSACATHEPRQLVPSISLSPENVLSPVNTGEPRTGGVDFGMNVTVNESDSLVNVTVLPGVRVNTVRPGSPSDLAGILPGDVILRMGDQETNHPDTVDAIALATDTSRTYTVEVRRDTTVFTTVMAVSPRAAPRTEPIELYRVDPIRLRAGFSTETLRTVDDTSVSGARIIRFYPESPLPGAGFNTDDIVLSINDEMVGSAQGLVTLVTRNHAPGDRVTIRFARDNEILARDVRLWDPGRRLSRLSLWPLFVYESSLRPDQTRLTIVDLWLFSLFNYQRSDGEREYSVLGLFRSASGYGELLEE